MKSLRQHIDEAGERYDSEIIMPEFLAWVGDRVVFVQAILELTAIVHPQNDVTDKSVVNLNKVLVDKVVWVNRAIQDRLNRKARRRGIQLSGITRV